MISSIFKSALYTCLLLILVVSSIHANGADNEKVYLLRSKLYQASDYQLGQSITEALNKATLIGEPELISKQEASIEIGEELLNNQFSGVKVKVTPKSSELDAYMVDFIVSEPFSENNHAVTEHAILDEEIKLDDNFLLMLTAKNTHYILIVNISKHINVAAAKKALSMPFLLTPTTINRVITDVAL